MEYQGETSGAGKTHQQPCYGDDPSKRDPMDKGQGGAPKGKYPTEQELPIQSTESLPFSVR